MTRWINYSAIPAGYREIPHVQRELDLSPPFASSSFPLSKALAIDVVPAFIELREYGRVAICDEDLVEVVGGPVNRTATRDRFNVAFEQVAQRAAFAVGAPEVNGRTMSRAGLDIDYSSSVIRGS